MSDPIVPDNLARSKSGRVPKWVVDEAKGIKTGPVPFRAPPTRTSSKPPRRDRGMHWLRLALTVAVVAIVAVVGAKTGIGSGGLLASSPAHTARDAPPQGLGEVGHPLGEPQPVVLPSTSYRFLGFQDDGKTPIRWSPCRPIHYVVRPDNAPPNGQRMIEDAMARVSTVTGFRFVYDGTTTEGPTSNRKSYQKGRYGDRWAPVLVAWATPAEVPDFGVDVAGEATPVWTRSGSGDFVDVSGTVFLDPVKLARVTAQYGEPDAGAIILHELGHLMGLQHDNDATQIMAPRVKLGVTEYQPGDLAGLNVLAGGPCEKDI